ncbi:HAD family hydrolase [Thiomicrospira cyclica]|uniref:Phosphoserine phosphatase n=1 Tax=Thiomicrospira cyclica (strain DSM 14477 / JCM 11371 / ALM1) TaxID=717773 RepID=F6DBU5_THICA|nr:HAD family hydrolase [Thiomicrospira cyclica]AEG31331.1 hypothetical protein Thicy_0559 [Thiomicrospira cyclica ALM1]
MTKPFVIVYDFDGTLAPGNMQEYDFIPALGVDVPSFWQQAGELAKQQEADQILAYMQLMVHEAQYKRVQIRKADFEKFGAKIRFFEGVEDWFERINAYGKARGIEVQHFIVSSGLREMIAGTPIAKYFTKIYASGFMYDHHDVAIWPALAVNYTTKTQYLFRISKGSLEVYDNSKINKYVPPEERPVPFTNMVFIGDGETDIPSMRLLKDYGGHSIAVYNPQTHQACHVNHLLDEGRVNLVAPANYRQDSNIDQCIKILINRMSNKG